MLIITDSAMLSDALTSSLAANIKNLLALRRDQLFLDTDGEYDLAELAHWIVVMRGDAMPEIEAAVNYPITPDPPWEWVLDHGGILEAPIILSDDGFGVVLIVPDEHGVDPELLRLLRLDAVAASPSSSAPGSTSEIRP